MMKGPRTKLFPLLAILLIIPFMIGWGEGSRIPNTNYDWPTEPGSTGEVPTVDADGNIEFGTAAGGSPGGSDGELQYNNLGAFGGVSDLTTFIGGTASEISVSDDGDGTVTIGIVDPLPLSKGGTGDALADGSAGQVLQSDGDGTTSWTSNWVGTAPGDLDMNKYAIKDTDDGVLEIDSNIKTDYVLDQDSNTFLGVGAVPASLAHTSGDQGYYNTGYGYQALYDLTTGDSNTGLGDRALQNVTTGTDNTAIGSLALGSATSSNSSTAVGYKALLLSTTQLNTAVGANAGYNATGQYNTAIGGNALRYATSTEGTLAVGCTAGSYKTDNSTPLALTGDNNTYIGTSTRGNANDETNAIVIGYQALGQGSNTTVIGNSSTTANYIHGDFHTDDILNQDSNTFFGVGAVPAGLSHTTGSTGYYNAMFGYGAGTALTTGYANTLLGRNAGTSLTTSYSNTFVGNNAGNSSLTGEGRNIAVGDNSFASNETGAFNVCVGGSSCRQDTNGSYNVGVGDYALYQTSGDGAVGIGRQAGYLAGGNTTAVGYSAARYQNNGSTDLTGETNSTYIGAEARGNANSEDNAIVIGYQALGQGSNTTVIGNTSTTGVSILGNTYNFGDNADDTDVVINALANSNDGSLTYMEDEDYWDSGDNFSIGQSTAGDNYNPVFSLYGDSDADEGATSTSYMDLFLQPHSNPVGSYWRINSTGSAVPGFHFYDQDVYITAGINTAGILNLSGGSSLSSSFASGAISLYGTGASPYGDMVRIRSDNGTEIYTGSGNGDATLTITATDDDADDTATLKLLKQDTGPGAIHSNDLLGMVTLWGRGATANYEGAYIQGRATQDWTDSAHGTSIDLHATQTGAASATQVLKVSMADNDSKMESGDLPFNVYSGTSGTKELAFYGLPTVFYMTADKDAQGPFRFLPASENTSLTDTDGEQSWMLVDVDVEQSGTAAYNGIQVKVDEDSLGDGTTGTCGDNSLICAGTDADPALFAVIHDGSLKQTEGDKTHGGYLTKVYSATSGTLTGATDSIPLAIPSGWVIQGCQLHVKTAVTSSGEDPDTWDAELNDGAQEEAIASAQSASQNTNVNFFCHADAGYGGTLTDAETNIVLTPDDGEFSGGEIEATCQARGFVDWTNE